MRVVKKTAAVLLAVIIAVSAFIVGYAENGVTTENEEKEQIEIRISEQYYDYTNLVVFSDLDIFAFETVNFYQINENDESILIKAISCSEYCSKNFQAPEGVFSVRIFGKNLFAPQGRYTLEFIAKETPPEGCEKATNVSVDFNYEDIINPEIENEIIDYTLEVGQKADIAEIINLPEDYLCVYRFYENKEDSFFGEQIIEIDSDSIIGVTRGETTLIIEDVFSYDTIAQINIRVIPETPDNFLELIGSTMGIIGTDTLKSFIQVGSYVGVGLGGLFYTLLFPIVAVLSFFGSLLGL